MAQVYTTRTMFSRTLSFPHDMEDPALVEQMFADLVYSPIEQTQTEHSPSEHSPAEFSPKSPISEENYPVSPNSIVENDVDAILDEVLSMHDSLSTPPSPKSTFSDDQITQNGAELTTEGQNVFLPNMETTFVSQELKEQPSQPIDFDITNEQEQQQGTIRTVMAENGEYFNVVVIPSDQVPQNYELGNVIFSPKPEISSDTKMEFISSPLQSQAIELLSETDSTGPMTPPPSNAQSGSISPSQSPVSEEKLSRKRCQNKQSSKRYRQKIKNKEQALFDAVGDLNKKKRELELELASTKAVNKFLVDSLKQKFGIF